MKDAHTKAGAALTALILRTFQLNGTLLSAGDALVRDIGLTSARWQVLGALVMAGQPLSVAQIARRMGLTRQAVQRVADDLQGAGLTTYSDNPDHKRAKLVALTPDGEAAYARADARQTAWANALAEGLDADSLAEAAGLLEAVHERCRGLPEQDIVDSAERTDKAAHGRRRQ